MLQGAKRQLSSMGIKKADMGCLVALAPLDRGLERAARRVLLKKMQNAGFDSAKPAFLPHSRFARYHRRRAHPAMNGA
jgi:hypothetical protein